MTAGKRISVERTQELAMNTGFSARRMVDRHRPIGFGPWARLGALVAACLVALTAFAPSLGAQSNGKGFLFSKPVGSFSFRAGWAVANAGSDVFADATSNLTLTKGDFSGFDWGGDISKSMGDRFDLVFDGEVAKSSANSEFRKFIDNNDQPIEQSTKFKRIPLTLGLKYYLTSRGRSISNYAYVPSRYAPYVTVGAGAMYYSFEQKGDFVDFQTLNVEPLTIESSGWAPMGRGAMGIEYTVGPWLALTGEGRYVWAKATLDPNAFEGYEKIDLSGFTGTVGFRVRF
jgi:hypothetical protein